MTVQAGVRETVAELSGGSDRDYAARFAGECPAVEVAGTHIRTF